MTQPIINEGGKTMQSPNEHGVYPVETVEELARVGQAYAAVRLCRCEDGQYRYALDFYACTMGFSGPILARDEGYPTQAAARHAGRDEMLRRWPTPWPSEPETLHRQLREMRQQIEAAMRQPSLF